MGRHRIYPPGQRPSDNRVYVPRPPREVHVRLDNALEELCSLQLGRPLTQEDIAEYAGVTQQCISHIEKQARKKLTFRLRALGIRPLPGGRGLDLRSALKGLA